ncbi:hypothetical protein [Algoriphagus sp.]|uniref:hypothetical protein n=1 Tax=Algoriphagus sp. TaxID=1872435 RepID=UPI003F718657
MSDRLRYGTCVPPVNLSLPIFAVFLFTKCGSISDVDLNEIHNTIEIHKNGLVGEATTYQLNEKSRPI